MSSRIALGIIRRPHGVRGEASVEPWTDSVERFSEVRAVTLVSPDERQTRAATIEACRPHRGRALIKFAEFDTPEPLRELRDWTIEIPESEAKKLEPDEYFLHDLIGLMLVDDQGNERGTVVETYEGGGGVLLKVQRGGRAYEVPFAAGICTRVDLDSRTIVVTLPEGLDEI